MLGYEEHIRRAFMEINDGTDPPELVDGKICSTVSLVATTNYQIIYYDHWEDGYEADLMNPVQLTTLVFGDGNPVNGGSGDDILYAGSDINLTSTQNLTGTLDVNGYVPVYPARNPAYLRYDGGDRLISVGGPVNLTHAMWPLNNSWIGGAWEIPSRQTYQDTFVYSIPVGEDLYVWGGGDTGAFGDFRNVYIQAMAYEDNTTLSINNGTQAVNIVLNRGQTYFSLGAINSTAAVSITINAGTVIRSNRPIQVGLVTGADGSFQSRFFTILPDKLLGAEYIVPVPSGGTNGGLAAEVYIFNPNDFAITVSGYDRIISTTFTISPATFISSTVAYSRVRGSYIPPDTALRLVSSDGVFGVLVGGGTSQTAYDWGFAAVPAKYLTREYYVPWSPGNYHCPGPQCASYLNGSPVWIAPLSNGTTFYVDFNQGGLDGIPDQIFTLDVLEQRRIFDPDNDNTGMHIWATGEFAAAWGEDPRTAGTGNPYLDFGTAILPSVKQWIAPLLTIDKQAEPTILPLTGGVVTFTLITRSYNAVITEIDITDTLPLSWTYVAGSTRVQYPLGGITSPEPTISGQVLHWDLGAGLDLQQTLTLTFQAQITDTTQTIHINKATAAGYYGYARARLAPAAETIVAMGDLDLRKQASHTDANVGDTLAYTLSYQNTNSVFSMTNVLIRDVLPVEYVSFVDMSPGGTYDSASGTVVWNLGTLDPGASGSVTLTLQINNFVRDGVLIRNTAYIDSDQTDWANSNTVQTRVHAAEVALSKSAPPAAAQGQIITYTLSYQNTGSAPATRATIYDTIPISTTYVPGSLAILTDTVWTTLSDAVDEDAGAFISPTLVISPGMVPGILAVGESGQIRFSVQINESISRNALILNWATLIRDLDNPRDSNLVITRISELVLNKAVSPTIAGPGSVLSYTLRLENLSADETHTDVYVQEAIPDYTQLLTDSIYGGQVWYSWDNGATFTTTWPITPVTHLRWYTATVPSGQVRTMGFAVRVQDTLPPNTVIQNMAHFWSNEIMAHIGQWLPSNAVTVGTINLNIAKNTPFTIVSPGQTLTYTVTYNNSGSVAAQAVITDVIDSTRNIASPTIQTQTLNIPARTAGVWEVGVTVASTATCGEVITNVASIWHSQHSNTSNPVVVTVSAPYGAAFVPSSPAICPGIPLTLTNTSTGTLSYRWSLGDGTLTDTVSPVYAYAWPGEYTIVLTATNLCGSDVASQTITVIDPPTASFSPTIAETWVGLPVTWTNASTGYVDLLWDLGDGTLTTTLSPTHSYAMPGIYTVTLTVTSTCGVSDVATGTVEVKPPLLAMHKEASTTLIEAGDLLTYTIVISNLSPAYATGGMISDTIPLYTTLIPGSIVLDPPTAGVIGTPPAMVSNLTLAPGAVVTLTMSVQVDGNVPNGVEAITNTATVTVTEGGGAQAHKVVLVSAAPELQVGKFTDRAEVRLGETLTYTIVVRNNGTQGATGVVMTDTLPLSVTVKAISGSGMLDADRVVWPLGDLDVGGILTETLVVTVSRGVPVGLGALTNTVQVTDDGANGPDLVPDNNCMTHTVKIEYAPALTLAKSGPITARVGERITFVLTVAHDLVNGDGSAVTAVGVSDSLAGTATLSGGDDGDGWLQAGEEWSFVASYVVRPSDPATLINVGLVEARDGDGDVITATANHQTGILYAPELMVGKQGPVSAWVGERVVFTITVSNVSIVPTGIGTAGGDGSPIYALTVSDSIAGPASLISGDNGNGILDFGERWLYVVEYTVRDQDTSPLENVATAQGKNGNGVPVYGTAQHSMRIIRPEEIRWLYFPLVLRNNR